MAAVWRKLSMLSVIATVMWGRATAQLGCNTVLMGLAPCLNYITGSSSTPSSSCCSQLGTVVQSQPRCLCQVLNGGGSSLGVTINQTQALALPGACKVQTPPVSQCNGGSSPAASPVGAPTSSPADDNPATSTPTSSSSTPAASTIPSGKTGSKSSTGGSTTSNGNIFKFPLFLTVVPLIFHSASIFIRI